MESKSLQLDLLSEHLIEKESGILTIAAEVKYEKKEEERCETKVAL